MVKVMLIDPPIRRHIIWDYWHKSQSIPLLSLAQYLAEKNDAEVRIIDAYTQGHSNRKIVHPEYWNGQSLKRILRSAIKDIGEIPNEKFIKKYKLMGPDNTVKIGLKNKEIAKYIKDFNPEVIGINCLATIYHPEVIKLSKFLKLQFPNKKIIVGGAHPTALPEKVLKDSEGAIDYVVIGEGEKTFSQLINNLSIGKNEEGIKGIAFFKNGKFICNLKSSLLSEQEIPLLNPKFIQNIEYPKIPLSAADTKGRKYIDVMFTRGCKGNCFFCHSPKMWKRVLRKMPIENVEKQLDLFKKFGYEELIIQDDNFILDRDYSRKVMKLIKEKGFYWQNNGGLELESLDEKIIEEMANSNCTAVFIPVHGRRRFGMRNNISKKLKNKAYKIFSKFKKEGIYVYGAGILGWPDVRDTTKTLEDMYGDIKFFKNLNEKGLVDYVVLFALSVLPGTELWYNRQKYGINIYGGEENYCTYSLNTPQVITPHMGYRQLCSAFLDAHLQINGKEKTKRLFSDKAWVKDKS